MNVALKYMKATGLKIDGKIFINGKETDSYTLKWIITG